MVIAAVCVGSSRPRILRMVPTLMAMHSFHSFKPALNSKRFQLGPSLDTRPKALTRAFFPYALRRSRAPGLASLPLTF